MPDAITTTDDESPLDKPDFPEFDGLEGIRVQAVELSLQISSRFTSLLDDDKQLITAADILADADLIVQFIISGAVPSVPPTTPSPSPSPTSKDQNGLDE